MKGGREGGGGLGHEMSRVFETHSIWWSISPGPSGPVGGGTASRRHQIRLAQVDKTTAVVAHFSVTGASAKPNFNCMGKQGCLVCHFLGDSYISGFSTVPVCSVVRGSQITAVGSVRGPGPITETIIAGASSDVQRSIDA